MLSWPLRESETPARLIISNKTPTQSRGQTLSVSPNTSCPSETKAGAGTGPAREQETARCAAASPPPEVQSALRTSCLAFGGAWRAKASWRDLIQLSAEVCEEHGQICSHGAALGDLSRRDGQAPAEYPRAVCLKPQLITPCFVNKVRPAARPRLGAG